ncbi:hypothetical protein ES703_114872 [subsurface metagenome]
MNPCHSPGGMANCVWHSEHSYICGCVAGVLAPVPLISVAAAFNARIPSPRFSLTVWVSPIKAPWRSSALLSSPSNFLQLMTWPKSITRGLPSGPVIWTGAPGDGLLDDSGIPSIDLSVGPASFRLPTAPTKSVICSIMDLDWAGCPG